MQDADIEDAGADAAPDVYDAGPPPDPRSLIRLEGRWDTTLPLQPRVAYPGARITLRFTGTGITLRLTEKASYRSYAGTSQYALRVDGVDQPNLVTVISPPTPADKQETRDYPLAAGLAPGEHVVELVRRTEAEFGSTRIDDVMVEDGAMLPPPPRPPHRIEFVGASNSLGYGIEASRFDEPPCEHTASNENWEKAFPARIAARFDAEVQAAVYSGKGVYYNSYRPDPLTLVPMYDRAIPAEPLSVFDASTFAAEAVVIDAGGNDYAVSNTDDYPSVEQVQGAYAQLVAKVRAAHPQAHIFCTLSPSVNDDYPYYQLLPDPKPSVMVRTKLRTAINAVIAARHEQNDDAIELFEFAQAGNDQHTACHFHPSPALQQTMATALGNRISQVMGW